jgi:hypothetical protein
MDGYRTEGDRWAVVDGPVAGGAWAVAVAVGGRAAAVEARADGAAGGARASRVHAALRLLDALHAAGARRGDAVALAGAGAAEYAPAARAVAASTGVQLLDPDAFAARAPAWAAWVAAETDGLGVRAVLELPGFRDAGADASDADADAARLALLADAAAVLAPHGRVLLAAPVRRAAPRRGRPRGAFGGRALPRRGRVAARPRPPRPLPRPAGRRRRRRGRGAVRSA